MHPPLTLHRHPMCAEGFGAFGSAFVKIAFVCFREAFLAGDNRMVGMVVLEDHQLVNLPVLMKIFGSFWPNQVTGDTVKQIIEEFQKCHLDHPIGKFFGDCTQLKIKLDRCFRKEKAVKRKANFEQSKKMRERLQAIRKETAEAEA
ncbi:hypothetical protein JRO89_XSUnG0103700 [Xanthoceras sorbifolium]|uniref:COX assembly mitochondrial protein n=1 Tax=Xanthoceras sorbifolium TaxID=99658 RepID=A0ABQ8GYM5_9ROSI|nr:hypothetical protein JRO89_XSUnG0103700 [Xanthoceras sorbifolium]